MPTGRRSSWKTSSQRRSRSGANTNNDVGINIYAKQLNPYKSKLTSSFRGSHNANSNDSGNVMRRPTEEDEFGMDKLLNLGDDDDDDDDLGLDNILSSISAIQDEGKSTQPGPSSGGTSKSPNLNKDYPSPKPIEAGAPSSGGFGIDALLDEEENDDIFDSIMPKKRPNVAAVDFGSNGITPCQRESTSTPPVPIQDAHPATIGNNQEDNVSPVSGEDNDTLWSDGDATKQHKMMVQTGQGPAFASGGFEVEPPAISRGLQSTLPMMGPEAKGITGSSSLVDSLINDIASITGSSHNISVAEACSNNLISLMKDGSAVMPPPSGVGRYLSSTNNNKRHDQAHSMPPTQKQPIDPSVGSVQTRRSGPQFSLPGAVPKSKKLGVRESNNTLPPSKVLTTTPNKMSHADGLQEDETLSTVTDPTESPFIYTYKKSGDEDDTVSQITSSLAGSASVGSSNLQNVPMINAGLQRNLRSGLPWMDNNNGTAGLGRGFGGSRMIHRKAGGGMVIPGLQGRDRNGWNKAPKYSSSSSMGASGGGRNSRGSSNSGSGSAGSGGGVASYEGGKSNLDEIAYALNTDCKTPGRNPRVRGRGLGGGAHHNFLGNNTREIGRGGGEDLSTVESSAFGDDGQSSAHPYIDTNVRSEVSRLGMGGVSTGAQSVSESTVDSSSTIGLFQSISMFVWRVQHHAGRFFFPTSSAVTQRKKFDRDDSMEDLADILLEEGAKTLPHRKRGRGIRPEDEDEDEDEIDYFSRAMSTSNNHHGSPVSSKKLKERQRKKFFLNSATLRIGALIFIVTTVIITYNMPSENHANFIVRPKGGEFRTGKQRLYDPYRENENDQVLDYATDVLVDNNRDNVQVKGIASSGRLGQLIENDFLPESSSRSDPDQQQRLQQQNFLVNGNIQLPSNFDALANVDDLLFQRGFDVPFYWHVPRSGGGTMNDVLGSCLHLTLAADAGGGEGHGQEETLKVIHFSRQVSYMNVDTSTHQGIARAKNLNLVSSGLADVVISPLLHEASTLFTLTRRGRMFTIVRHPVERAASLFYFIQETQWKQHATRNEQFADITIEQFYKNGFAENNWMTRFLTNELTKGQLTENDLTIAKEVLRQKCLVGLLEEKGETFERIQKYFGWRPKNEEDQDCLEKKLEWAWPMKHKHPPIEEDSRAWRLIAALNKFDLRLYNYAKELFTHQGEQLFHQ